MQKTKRARKKEHGRNKFRGEERDQSRVDGMILKDELKTCLRSKRSLSQQLCETETNMLAIISKYKEELNLATAHEHKVAGDAVQPFGAEQCVEAGVSHGSIARAEIGDFVV